MIYVRNSDLYKERKGTGEGIEENLFLLFLIDLMDNSLCKIIIITIYSAFYAYVYLYTYICLCINK